MNKNEAVAVKELFDIIDQLLFIGFKGVSVPLENFAKEIDEEVDALKDELIGIKR